MSHLDGPKPDHHGDSPLASSIYSDSLTSTRLVASLDQITADGEPSTPPDRRMSLLSIPQVQPRRPPFQQRSFSDVTSYTASATNSPPLTASLLTRLSSSQAQYQWSLFGQLMENGARLRSSVAVLPGPSRRSLEQNFPVVQQPSEVSPGDVHHTTQMPAHPQETSTQDVYSEQVSTTAEEVSSETSDETATATTRGTRMSIPRWIPSRVPTIPRLWKNILKCSIAYFIGSLFTFHPSLSRFFGDLASSGDGDGGPYPSAHMIATM